ncbi:uncharacterized protein LOC113347021 [Papaver somniferum]|uniref:uncharacterized protein LOC113347021 n=1 Tax=Papaver somniferum TaxID=3469 RepID=UPI000E704925|nr:uncharacterized protein LOC113347021 [Papaver somniferum]XP_026446379.1 uncharacterized protein LOC113347021 [Papaver somniferum]
MEAAGKDYSGTSPERSFEVNKTEDDDAFEEVMAKIEVPLREADRAIRGMSILHLCIARGRTQNLLASINREEKWTYDEASQPLVSTRAERFAVRLKRRQIEYERPPSEDKHDYVIRYGVIILDSDTDEPARPKVVKTISHVALVFEEDMEVDPTEGVEAENVADFAEISEREAEVDPKEEEVAAYDNGVEGDSDDGEAAVDLLDD